jgi:ribosomal-protein-alanine N-acetyltransferase
MKFLLEGHETERLLFRKISELDFESWLKFFEDPQTSLHWVEEKETALIACKKWYAKQLWRYEKDKGGMNALVEKETGRLVGHAGLLIQTVDGKEELEIGYSLLPPFWNKGYAIEAATKCKEFAIENKFYESLISIISLSNIPSQKVALKNGMVIDKKTIYHDNEVYIFRLECGLVSMEAVVSLPKRPE